MKAVLLFSIVSVFVNAVYSHCDACLEKQCYTKNHLGDINGYDAGINAFTNSLYIDRYRNIIHFNNIKNSASKVEFQVRSISIDSKRTSDYFPWRFMDLAVDENTNEVYITEYLKRHIYNWNITSHYLNDILADEDFNKLEYKGKLYFTISFKKGIYFYEHKKPTNVNGTDAHYVEDFIVDKKGDIYFVTLLKTMIVWRLKNGTSDATVFTSGSIRLTLDKNGNAFFINTYTRGIAKVNYDTEKIEEVGAFDDSANGIVFDKENNIIYATTDKIYYLKQYNDTSNCSVESVAGKKIILKPSINQSFTE